MSSSRFERLLAPIGYAVGRFLIRAWLAAGGVTVQVRGMDKVPSDGPAILVGNHPSVIDGLLLVSVVPRRLRGFAHNQLTVAALYRDRRMLQLARSVFFGALSAIPVEAGPPTAAALAENLSALEAAREWLSKGNLLVVAPEGYPNPSTLLRPFGAGPMLLASELGVPIIPAVISGSDRVLSDPLQPSFRRILRPNRTIVWIEFLAPMCFRAGPIDRSTLRARTTQLQSRIEGQLHTQSIVRQPPD